jgi:uncharacterized protein YdcH (DUF465 family)
MEELNNEVQEPEILLELHRELTDKEKLAFLTQKFKKLVKKYKDQCWLNTKLVDERERLKKRIEEDEIKYPSTYQGGKNISVKAYFKLYEKYKDLDQRFWEVVQERNSLKNAEPCEKL